MFLSKTECEPAAACVQMKQARRRDSARKGTERFHHPLHIEAKARFAAPHFPTKLKLCGNTIDK